MKAARQAAHHVASVETDLQFLETNASATALCFEHVLTSPPHGPFAYLSALSLSEKLEDELGAKVTPQACLQFFRTHWETDHLREWASFYAAADPAHLEKGLALATPSSAGTGAKR